jgi:hypothetical protein
LTESKEVLESFPHSLSFKRQKALFFAIRQPIVEVERRKIPLYRLCKQPIGKRKIVTDALYRVCLIVENPQRVCGSSLILRETQQQIASLALGLMVYAGHCALRKDGIHDKVSF